MIALALKHWKPIAISIAVLSVLCALWAYGHTKYREGYEACMTAQIKADIEGVKTNEKIRHKVIRLSDPDLDNRLGKWVR